MMGTGDVQFRHSVSVESSEKSKIGGGGGGGGIAKANLHRRRKSTRNKLQGNGIK